jgi:transcriptional regulator with XRE-family HTH domain
MFYEQYVELCTKLNKSPSGVAQELGISKTSVTRWKNGAIPNSKIINKIADYFEVSTDYIIKGNEEQKSDSPKSKTEKEFIVLARRTPNMSEKDHKEFIKFIEDSAETFFRLKGIINNDEETDKDKKN